MDEVLLTGRRVAMGCGVVKGLEDGRPEVKTLRRAIYGLKVPSPPRRIRRATGLAGPLLG